MARPRKQINPAGYYIIHNWMLTHLGLSGSKLLVYAFIYAYSVNESGKGCYFGGYEAMSLSVGCSTRNLQNVTQELYKSGLIEILQVELSNGLTRNYFRVCVEPLERIAASVDGMEDQLKALQSFDASWSNIRQSSKNLSKREIKVVY